MRKFVSLVPMLSAAEKRSQAGRPTAVGAFNVNFYSQAAGILAGLQRANAPGIIQASRGACEFQGGADQIAAMTRNAMQATGHIQPVCLHLDHGNPVAAITCVDKGFSSVMFDASHLEFAANIAATQVIVEYAHSRGVSVEGEYGTLAGVEEDITHNQSTYADPTVVPQFFTRSKVDALAIAYGTKHGANKHGMERLAVDIVRESYAGMVRLGLHHDHFLVSHGSSTVPRELVEEILDKLLTVLEDSEPGGR